MTDPVRADGVRLAVARRVGTGPTIVFLPGYRSDMTGGKAIALDAWAAGEGRAMLRLDYAGCGASGGAFEDFTLDDWLDDVLLAIDRLIEGPVVLVGSSMGGWLMLLAALARPGRVAGLIGIAAAPDFTDWGFDEDEQAAILADGRIEQPSAEGDAPMVTTRDFFESGQAHRLLASEAELAIDCPVRLLHGQNDPEVPFELALLVAHRLRSDDVQVTLVKDGDHRLSRDADIALLLRTVAGLMERP